MTARASRYAIFAWNSRTTASTPSRPANRGIRNGIGRTSLLRRLRTINCESDSATAPGLPKFISTSDMQIEQIDPFRHRIARDESRGMRTDVVVYASAPLMEQIRKDSSLEQAM